MGFYFRKSISLGPLRFNFSKSGVGVSTGFRGLRVGTGPRGNYVRIGRGGVYYQKTFRNAVPAAPPETAVVIESVSASLIADSSSEQLLDEIREKDRLWSLTPLAIAAAVILFLFAVGTESSAFVVFALICGAAMIVAAKIRDIQRRRVVIDYDLEPAAEQAFHAFRQCADDLASAKRTWHVASSSAVFQKKYHAGASALVQRQPTTIRTSAPPRMRTNVPVLSIGAGTQTLYFLPDRLLIYDRQGVGAVSYRSLEITVTSQRFIESGGVPSDATVVDSTWQYVNRNGGPDRRFNYNPRVPICAYDELHFRSASGLDETVQVSRCGVAEPFAAALRQLGKVAA